MNILMVCTANFCRSPMAAGIARFLLKAAGRADVRLDSAATHAYCLGKAADFHLTFSLLERALRARFANGR